MIKAPMNSVFLLPIFVALTTPVFGQEVELPGSTLTVPTKYLSEAEVEDMARQLALAAAKSGRHQSRRNAYGDNQSELSFDVLIVRDEEYQQMMLDQIIPREPNARLGLGVGGGELPSGQINCSTLDNQTPHLGSGPNSTRVPKAKSGGDCYYQHTGPGDPPPNITWSLYQFVRRWDSEDNLHGIWQDNHNRSGLSVTWSPSSAQIFGECPSPSDPLYYGADYDHWFNLLYIFVPNGWHYTGPFPLSIGSVKENYFSC